MEFLNILEENEEGIKKLVTTKNSTGFSILLGKSEVETFRNKIIELYNGKGIYQLGIKELENGEEICIKQASDKRKRDFSIHIYNNGKILIQTKKKEEFTKDLELIGYRAWITNEEKTNEKEKETKMIISSPKMNINKKRRTLPIEEDDQSIINKNMENNIMKLLLVTEDIKKELEILKTENTKLKDLNEKNNLNCWEWVEKRYKLLMELPKIDELTHQIEKTKKLEKEIKKTNERINNIEKINKQGRTNENVTIRNEIKSVEASVGIIRTEILKNEESHKVTKGKVNDLVRKLEWDENEKENGLKEERKKDKTRGNRTNEGKQTKEIKERSILIFGDSILKYIDVSKLLPETKHSKNLCKPGAVVEDIENQIKGHETGEKITDVIVHIGTNDLGITNKTCLINDIARTIHTAQKSFPNAIIYYSPIIPKKQNNYINTCDEINRSVKFFCEQNGFIYIDTRNLFVDNNGIRFDRLSRYDRIHLNRNGIVALGKHLKFIINSKYKILKPPPYSPPSSPTH